MPENRHEFDLNDDAAVDAAIDAYLDKQLGTPEPQPKVRSWIASDVEKITDDLANIKASIAYIGHDTHIRRILTSDTAKDVGMAVIGFSLLLAADAPHELEAAREFAGVVSCVVDAKINDSDERIGECLTNSLLNSASNSAPAEDGPFYLIGDPQYNEYTRNTSGAPFVVQDEPSRPR